MLRYLLTLRRYSFCFDILQFPTVACCIISSTRWRIMDVRYCFPTPSRWARGERECYVRWAGAVSASFREKMPVVRVRQRRRIVHAMPGASLTDACWFIDQQMTAGDTGYYPGEPPKLLTPPRPVPGRVRIDGGVGGGGGGLNPPPPPPQPPKPTILIKI